LFLASKVVRGVKKPRQSGDETKPEQERKKMEVSKLKTTLGCMVMAAFLLAGCDKTEEGEEGKAALSIGTKAAAPKGEEQEYMEAYKYYLAHKTEITEKIRDCSSKRDEISMKELSGKELTASDRARLTGLNTGACKAAEDAHLEIWHGEQEYPQWSYQPSRGAKATGLGAESIREARNKVAQGNVK
jgi:hypothetical protein